MDESPTVEPPAAGPGRLVSAGRRGPPRRRRRRRAGRPLVLGAALLLVVVGVAGWRLLAGSSAPPGAWGGHENGRIPAAELCALAGQPNHRLRCDAAAAYGNLAAAYRTRFDTRLCITDSYRTLEGQVTAAERKPDLAATPGTSNHGWALAVDLCGGANDFGTRQHRWLQANAGRHGWRQPGWAAKGGSRPEPWHWEFGDLS